MSILDNLSAKRHEERLRFPSWRKRQVIAITSHESREAAGPHYGFDIREDHRLDMTIGVVFTCNKAQYPDAMKRARAQIGHVLFRDIHLKIHELRGAVDANDEQACVELLNALEDLCK